MKQVRIVLLFLTLSLHSVAAAQYLEVRRSATVKRHPVRDAQVIERVKEGNYLKLLDGGRQDNGYYRVRATSVNQVGWIYRTLVTHVTHVQVPV